MSFTKEAWVRALEVPTRGKTVEQLAEDMYEAYAGYFDDILYNGHPQWALLQPTVQGQWREAATKRMLESKT